MARPSPQTDRVVALVELLSAEGTPTLTLAEATRRLGVNKSTCHSMLTALHERGWLARDPVTLGYRLGPALIGIGHRAAEGFPALELARPVLVAFAHRHGAHCVALSIAGDRGTVVDQVRDPRSTSRELPTGDIVLRPPLGALIYAWEEEATVTAWLEGESGAAREHHRQVLELIRSSRFSVELATPPETRLRNLVAQLREGLAREGGLTGTPTDAGGDRADRADRSEGSDRPDRPDRPEASIEEMVDLLAGELAAMERFQDFLPLTLEPGGEYVVSSLGAPVFDRAGRVTLAVSILGFPGPATGAEIERIGRELSDATAEVTRQSGGSLPPNDAARHRGGTAPSSSAPAAPAPAPAPLDISVYTRPPVGTRAP